MIEGARRWLRRNRTGLTIGFGVIGIGYVAGQYAISKITEARERMAGDRIAKENLRRRFQQNQEDCTITVLELLPTVTENILEALPSEKIAEEIQQKKGQRLGRSTGASDITPSDISSITPGTAADEDSKSLSSFQSETYVHASQMGASSSGSGEMRPPKNKTQLWGELKISSVTRSFTLLYTVSLLSLLTRIQLNLLGRKSYLSSVVSMASHRPQDHSINLENRDDDNAEKAYGNDFELNRTYLTFSWWLLHRGWREILRDVESAVRDVFGPHKPTEEISLERLSSLILDVRRKVEGATPDERRDRKWLSFLLPPQEQEQIGLEDAGISSPPPTQPTPRLQDHSSLPSPPASLSFAATKSSPLRRLLDETSDLIDSPMFTHVLTLLLDATFSQLADTKLRSEAYKLPLLTPEPAPAARITEVIEADPANVSTKLANILAILTREAHKIGNGVLNEYVQAAEGVSELEGFAAVIYSSNFEFEAGLKASVTPDSSRSGSGDEAATRARPLDNLSVTEAEEAVKVVQGRGIIDKAAGAVDTARGGFERFWGMVVGSESS